MSIEEELEALGWDKDLVEAFKKAKSELQSIKIEDNSSIIVHAESSEKTDGSTIQGVLDIPIGFNELLSR